MQDQCAVRFGVGDAPGLLGRFVCGRIRSGVTGIHLHGEGWAVPVEEGSSLFSSLEMPRRSQFSTWLRVLINSASDTGVSKRIFKRVASPLARAWASKWVAASTTNLIDGQGSQVISTTRTCAYEAMVRRVMNSEHA